VVDVERVRDLPVGLTCDLGLLERVAPDDGLRRLVLGAHERQRFLGAEVAPPGPGDPVRIGVPERRLPRGRFGERFDQLAQPEREPAQDCVRERDRALEAGRADELDRLVHGCVLRNLRERELVGTEAQRRPYRRVELPHRPPPELLDPVVERAHTLDRPVGQPLRERAVALVEPLGGRRKGPVGVRVLLEDAADGLERRPPRGRHAHRRPRRNSS
jgi:hypothetical protein